ncbi:MAG: hypothetical protein AMJ90_05125 [candidate division Zixibacteria bacterium SM23_73_2]|nr:MAG: hypothetical protein AMJ90_05125 [candidate division Zixibacteria bacterium SM23_73_2]
MVGFKHVLNLFLLFATVQFVFYSLGCGEGKDTENHNVSDMLNYMAEVFKGKIDEDFSVVVQFDFKDINESWHVMVEKGRKVTVNKGLHNGAQFIFITTVDTLGLIYGGKMTAATAAGKAEGSDHAPLDLKWADGLELTPEIREKFYSFIFHFFNPSVPEKVLLGEEYSRLVHGGHVITLYYHPGFRSAWYLLKKGERLNQPGDKNPFPQAFIFIEGEGFAKIGDKTIKVKAGESYYIPPDSDHVVWTESDDSLVLIWLAWGEGA